MFGDIPQVATKWTALDLRQTFLVRWNIGRMRYVVDPGLYAVGQPDQESEVFVSANFKLSFDHLRRALDGMNAWILVLDTKGINVWCAAGKGTFGTEELLKRIKIHALLNILDHRRIIVPQLGAVGVSAHEVKKRSGFTVIYGPVRADDIAAFLKAGNRATPEMREVRFPLQERLKLIPIELSYGKYYLILVPLVFLILSGIYTGGYDFERVYHNGMRAVLNLFAAYFAGTILTPILLPLIPLRRFSLKGLVLGWGLSTLFLFLGLLGSHPVEMVAWYLMMGSVAAFLAMNWTGSSTFTSLSGVQKEMRLALPMQMIAAAIGFIMWVVSRFL